MADHIDPRDIDPADLPTRAEAAEIIAEQLRELAVAHRLTGDTAQADLFDGAASLLEPPDPPALGKGSQSPTPFIPLWVSLPEAEEILGVVAESQFSDEEEWPEKAWGAITGSLGRETPMSFEQMRAVQEFASSVVQEADPEDLERIEDAAAERAHERCREAQERFEARTARSALRGADGGGGDPENSLVAEGDPSQPEPPRGEG